MVRDYIDRAILKEQMIKYGFTSPDMTVTEFVEDLPSAESEPKKGKWIKRDSYDRRDNFYSCSICGRIINVICGAHLEDYPFCHCGADMRGEEK